MTQYMIGNLKNHGMKGSRMNYNPYEWQDMSCYVMSCHGMSYHVMTTHVMTFMS